MTDWVENDRQVRSRLAADIEAACKKAAQTVSTINEGDPDVIERWALQAIIQRMTPEWEAP